MRISIAQPFKISNVQSDGGSFGQRETYEVLAIGVIDPESEDVSTDFRSRTRLLVADDERRLVWVKTSDCRVIPFMAEAA